MKKDQAVSIATAAVFTVAVLGAGAAIFWFGTMYFREFPDHRVIIVIALILWSLMVICVAAACTIQVYRATLQSYRLRQRRISRGVPRSRSIFSSAKNERPVRRSRVAESVGHR